MKMTIDRTALEKKPLRFVVIGSGWRSLFYWRIACAYPELFTMEAMLCRTEEKAGHMRKQYGVPAVTSEAVCEAMKPDFMVAAVNKASIFPVTKQWAGKGFPVLCETPAALELDELKELKLGYRAKYIYQLCQDAVSGALDLALLDTMDYGTALGYLTGFYGIGKKVANCVCLFGLHHIGAFPVDTWIEKILMAQYYDKRKYRRTPKTCLCDTIVKDVFGQYGGCAGVMQQYIFYYERLRNSKLS